ncbi:uncharacterized protein LOC144817989 [Lissotriton helveticus]
MSQEVAGTSSTGRKRKIKFSEQELEHLIEGVSRDHDRLFRKDSRRVPEADKRRIWLRIRAKVNSVEVAQRSIDDLKKRWYDLRGRAKERIAERLGERVATGGGEPTVPPNTPLEDLVEDTLQPEACVGVTRLDSSRPTQESQGGAEDTSSDSEGLQIDENPEDSEGDANPSTQPGPSGRAPAALPPPATPATTGAPQPPTVRPMPVASATAAAARPPTQRTPTVPTQSSGQVRERRQTTPRAGRSGVTVRVPGLSIERRMLRVHQQQARHLAAIHLQLHNTARNVGQLSDRVERMTTAVEANTEAMLTQRDLTRRRHRQLLTRLSAYMRSNYIIGNATSQLSRRSLAMQIQMVQCCQDVARALEQATTAVQALQATGHGQAGGDDASEGTSSHSSLSLPPVRVPRRSSRPTAASQANPEEDVERRIGASGRRRH